VVGQSSSTSGSSSSSSSSSSTSSGGGGGFITLTDLNSLKFDASINEADISKIRVGESATFTVEAYPGRTFNATIAAISPQGASTSNVVNFTVTGTIPQTSDRTLLPGMTATISIVTAEASDAIVVPNGALAVAQTQVEAGKVKAPAQPTRAPGAATPGVGGQGAFGQGGQFRQGQGGTQGTNGAGAGAQRTPGAGFGGRGGQSGTGAGGQGGRGGATGTTPEQGANGQATPGRAGGEATPGTFSGLPVAPTTPVPSVVLVMGSNGKPEARLVITGLSDGRNTQIMSGLQDGEKIITQVITSGKQPTQAAGGGGGIFPGGGGGARPGGGR
jgi:hypothetical protein